MSACSVFNAKAICSNLPSQPGVYRMLNSADQVIYVGKAINLKRKLEDYLDNGYIDKYRKENRV